MSLCWESNGEEDPRDDYDFLDLARAKGAPDRKSANSNYWIPGHLIRTSHPRFDDREFDFVQSLYKATGDGNANLVGSLVLVVGTWVGDLPASQRNHHASPFGLLHHSLDTAARFVAWASRSRSSDTLRNRWLVVGATTAFLHDIGKILDVEVTDPGSRELWDPRREALTHFRARHRVPHWGRRDFRWRPSRGAHGHDVDPFALVDAILPLDYTPAFRRDLREVFEALGCRSPRNLDGYPWPLPYLSVAIRQADRESASFGGLSR
jgi:hypothetical protein